jgi:L-lactate dehydrogenase complex protein LldG
MSARDQILGGIRKSLGRGPLNDAAAAPLRRRLNEHPSNLIPARTKSLNAEGLATMFKFFAEEADATVTRVPDAASVPLAVTEYLASRNLPAEAVRSPDAALDAYPWSEVPLLRMHKGRATGEDAVSITPAFAAVAESGTVMLTSGADRPTTLNFLPGTHIVVLRKDQIVGDYEQAWQRLRKTADARGEAMPRAVNLVTGPSRTGDIEQKLQLGAHGPIRLHIVIVDN